MRLCHTRDLEGCRLGQGATNGSPGGTPYLQPADLGPGGQNQVRASVHPVLTPRRGCALPETVLKAMVIMVTTVPGFVDDA